MSFVAKGTIEEGMLTLLGFKRSVFAGVLDGGEREVFLGGNRLKRFIEGVERVTSAIAEPVVEESAPRPAPESPDEDTEVEAAASARPATTGGALADLLRTGAQLLDRFLTEPAAHLETPARRGDGDAGRPLRIARDELTGERYLKIKMPEPEVVKRVAQSLQALLDSLTR